MDGSSGMHEQRRRAGSFGAAAGQYDRFRPRYPRSLIAALVVPGAAVLDVGAGTGIASAQLRDDGADVLAVEPDPHMAAVASAKGIPVEQASFDDWRPSGRSFDLVVFAQSFHWVEPRSALTKIDSILRPDGRLALLWNRIIPTAPTQHELDEATRDHLDTSEQPAVKRSDDTALTSLIEECGFDVERRGVVEEQHFTTEAWVGMVLTYSNVLTLAPTAQADLRDRLDRHIGSRGVTATNDAVALVCTRRTAPGH